MSDIGQRIGENIRILRKAKGLSQEQLALRADINASYMGQVERGEKNPTIDVLNKIAAALHTPLEDVVNIRAKEAPAVPAEAEESRYAEKIAIQLQGLNVKEQEAVYKFVKQLVQFKELHSFDS
ncbi:helix-turn-helix domain-containing protein [Paenibacillus soyae]|uniref:Helix-turn-helix domain-containing protein n=1 Tax=Paenibacillus soyae TaxID=2969249 RepID=A0A9X2S8L6_9BACL|nr:helix-turn-helix transcriptional regulator [Paenibacillus soyae]MCR2802553.1 helix-turn-helix domain-containing protein [Paenibacillus soyae]